MDALELLINRRSASHWLNLRQRVNNCKTYCERVCVRRTISPCNRGIFVIEGEGRERFSALLEQGRLLPVVMKKLSTKRVMRRSAHRSS